MSELTIPAWRDDEGIGTLQDDEPESYCPNCAYPANEGNNLIGRFTHSSDDPLE